MIAWFHASYLGILDKCRQHLAGGYDLYPIRPRYGHRPMAIPTGPADLAFAGASLPQKSATATQSRSSTRAEDATATPSLTFVEPPEDLAADESTDSGSEGRVQ